MKKFRILLTYKVEKYVTVSAKTENKAISLAKKKATEKPVKLTNKHHVDFPHVFEL